MEDEPHDQPAPRSSLAVVWREPYRLLFPLGAVHVALSVVLWLREPSTDPAAGATHMTLMVAGFLGAVVPGFLMPVAPRLLQVPRVSRGWPAASAALSLAGLASAPFDRRVSLALAAAGLWNLVAFAVVHALRGARRHPPRVALGAVALAAGAVAATLEALAARDVVLPLWCLRGAHGVLTQGALLLLVAALGGVLLPRWARGASPVGDGTAPAPSRRHEYSACVASALVFVATFPGAALLAGPDGMPGGVPQRMVHLLRAALITWALAPTLWLPGRQPRYVRAAQVACHSIVLGVLGAALDPVRAVDFGHLVFVSGFLLMAMVVAARLATAHAGCPARLDDDRCAMNTITACVVLAAWSRLGAAWAPDSRALHLQLASVLALLALGVWAWRYGALLWHAPARPEECRARRVRP